MSKYQPLREHLERVGADVVPMTFSEIESVLGFDLPKSKYYPAWWSNNSWNNVMTREWLAAGYKSEQVDIQGQKLVFRREAAVPKGVEVAAEEPERSHTRHPRRHPLFGFMAGTVKIPEGVDLTEPADPDWADIAWG